MEIADLFKRLRAEVDKNFSNKTKKELEGHVLASIMKNIFEVEQYEDYDPPKAIYAMNNLLTSYIWLLGYYKLDAEVIKFEFTKEELDNFSWYWLLERFGKNLKKNQLNIVFNKKEFRDDFNNQKLYYKEQFFECLNLYLAKKGLDAKRKIIESLEYAPGSSRL